MPGCLYVVSTPIGNLDDITQRALTILRSVSTIAAEDTRRTGQLLRHFGISTPLTSLHGHNEGRKVPALLSVLERGCDIALVSDAGTPVISDPGRLLVQAAAAQEVRVVPIPGASAVMAALSVSGFPADSFVFLGFAPTRPAQRARWMDALTGEPRTVIFFEAPHRIRHTLRELSHKSVNRPIIVARELTKLHEEVRRGTTSSISADSVLEKGEFTVVLGPTDTFVSRAIPVSDQAVSDEFYQLTKIHGRARRAAVTETARKLGLSTKEVYDAVERVKRRAEAELP
jgi:16S rRNA (cytidine1402-2'-O)-methyltransferase